jgi:hypothetical protein
MLVVVVVFAYILDTNITGCEALTRCAPPAAEARPAVGLWLEALTFPITAGLGLLIWRRGP